MPDGVDLQQAEKLKAKSQVLAVPINQQGFAEAMANHQQEKSHVLQLCWAARWEYDKGPALLCDILEKLEARKINYQITILGQAFRYSPKTFAEINKRFSHRIGQFGFLEHRADYLAELARSDVFLSTAEHEFFGISVAEADALGCALVLPSRLVYPELYPAACLYNTADEAVDFIAGKIAGKSWPGLESTQGESEQQNLLASYRALIHQIAG
jgi:glycosyltransferase involved in cell wall biosynthesis